MSRVAKYLFLMLGFIGYSCSYKIHKPTFTCSHGNCDIINQAIPLTKESGWEADTIDIRLAEAWTSSNGSSIHFMYFIPVENVKGTGSPYIKYIMLLSYDDRVYLYSRRRTKENRIEFNNFISSLNEQVDSMTQDSLKTLFFSGGGYYYLFGENGY